MNRRRSPLHTVFIVLMMLGICLGGVWVAVTVGELPGMAAERFGPASPELSTFQHYRLAAQLLWQQVVLLSPADEDSEAVPFEITLGEDTSTIIQRLQEAGLIRDASAFRNYLIYRGYDTQLQAGQYSLSAALTPVEIAEALLDPTPNEVTFTILAGWRLEEIAASLPTSGLTITPQEFLQAASSVPAGYSFSEETPPGASLEGLLPPGTYTLQRSITVGELLDALLTVFDENVSEDIRQGLAQQGLTLYEGVILASVVQREAVLVEEQPTIASVFLNRLAIDMMMESDPTAQYALGYNGEQDSWWTNPLTQADLQVDSPYNTYLYPGLPPGPIAAPSLSALQAVAFPAQTPYYYFRAACDDSGRHNFATTFDEHLSNACE